MYQSVIFSIGVGVLLGIVLVLTGYYLGAVEYRQEACLRGYAHYVIDDNGASQWEWK
jgi:hypothetical protein